MEMKAQTPNHNVEEGDGSKGEDEESMRLAYEHYMLGMAAPADNKHDHGSASPAATTASGLVSTSGGSPTRRKKTPSSRRRQQQRPASGLHHPPQSQNQARLRKNLTALKRVGQLREAFASTVRHQWLSLDDDLGDVLASVLNIRTRLPLESAMLARFAVASEERGQMEGAEERGGATDREGGVLDWKRCGYRGNNCPRRRNDTKGGDGSPSASKSTSLAGFLTRGDIELAHSHDLRQHETMLCHVRRLLSSMAEAHRAVGRRLDDAVRYRSDHVDALLIVGADVDDDDEAKDCDEDLDLVRSLETVEDMEDVHAMLSKELYRKQRLAAEVLTSCDGLIVDASDWEGGEGSASWSWRQQQQTSSSSGIGVASRCCKEWPRGSRRSCVDVAMLTEFLGGK